MDVLGILLAAFASAWGLDRSFKDSWRPAQKREGGGVLRYGPLIRLLGLACGIVLPMLILGLLVTGWRVEGTDDVYAGLGMIVLSGSFGWLFLLSAWKTYVSYSEEGLVAHSFLRLDPRELRWDEVEEVRFAPVNGYLIFISGRGDKVRVSVLMVGLPSLLAAVRDHLPVPMYQEAVAALVQRVTGEEVSSHVR